MDCFFLQYFLAVQWELVDVSFNKYITCTCMQPCNHWTHTLCLLAKYFINISFYNTHFKYFLTLNKIVDTDRYVTVKIFLFFTYLWKEKKFVIGHQTCEEAIGRVSKCRYDMLLCLFWNKYFTLHYSILYLESLISFETLMSSAFKQLDS